MRLSDRQRVERNPSVTRSVHILNVFLLILICDRDVTTSRLQVYHVHLTKSFIVGRKGQFQYILDVIISSNTC